MSALSAAGKLPKGSTAETIAHDLAMAFELTLSERQAGEQLLLAVEGYRALHAEISEAIRNGQRPNVCLPSKLREALRKRRAA